MSESTPAQVNVGVIVWPDVAGDHPTVLVNADSDRLARTMATTLYEMTASSKAVAEFQDNHHTPAQWQRPEDVHAWLEGFGDTPGDRAFRSNVSLRPPARHPMPPMVLLLLCPRSRRRLVTGRCGPIRCRSLSMSPHGRPARLGVWSMTPSPATARFRSSSRTIGSWLMVTCGACWAGITRPASHRPRAQAPLRC